MASTIRSLPNLLAASESKLGFVMAAELTLTFVAPNCKTSSKSLIVRIPPPTVKGIETTSAICLINSNLVALPSVVADISRNTSSSTPALS